MSTTRYILLIFVAMLGIYGVSLLIANERVAVNALEVYGFSDIQITDKQVLIVSLLGCGRDDLVKYDAVATNPAGERVSLFVCHGLFKGATVRSH